MSDPRPSNDFVPDITLERYLLGELPGTEARRLEARIASDSVLKGRVEALEASNREILAELPAETFARSVQARLRRQQVEKAAEEALTQDIDGEESPRLSPGWRPIFASLGMLALLSLPTGLWLFGERTSGTVGSDAGTLIEETRIKGLEPQLAVFRRTTEGAEALHPGGKARPGDILRLGYQSGGFRYGAIFSVDGNGNVTRHWPAQGDEAGSLRGGEVLLPSAFKLDAAPGYERFFLVVSDGTFALNPLLEVLHAHRDIPSGRQPRNTRVVRFDVTKENGI